MKDTPPEFELIALCCREAIDALGNGRQSDCPVSRVIELAGGVCGTAAAQDRIIRLCRRHRVGPLVYRGLVAMISKVQASERLRTDGDLTDVAVLERIKSGLENHYFASLLSNERLQREVSTIAEWFAAAGIRAVPFKGPVLAWQLYGDVALRPSSDLDFILHDKDLLRARDLLEGKGFRSLRKMTAVEDRIWSESGWGYDMGSAEGGFTVDIASRVTPYYLPYSLDSDDFWSETRDLNFNGSTIRVMSPELMLIFLCWHGTKHMWENLIWVADLHGMILQRPGLDWSRVQCLARQSGTSVMLDTGLCVVRSVFGTPLPDGINSGLDGEPRTAHLADMCVQQLEGRAGARIGWLQEQMFFLRMRETLRGRLWCVLRTLVSPTISDCQAVRLPPSLFVLYYLIRPFRLLFKVIMQTSKSASGGTHSANSTPPAIRTEERAISPVELAKLAKVFLGDRGCSIRITVNGASMRPFLRDGDILTIIASDGSGLRVGDVALHGRAGGSVVAHRVLRRFMRDGKIFIETRGDALAGARDLATTDSIIGKVVSAQRGMRILRIDGALYRAAAMCWVMCSPFSQALLRFTRRPGGS